MSFGPWLGQMSNVFKGCGNSISGLLGMEVDITSQPPGPSWSGCLETNWATGGFHLGTGRTSQTLPDLTNETAIYASFTTTPGRFEGSPSWQSHESCLGLGQEGPGRGSYDQKGAFLLLSCRLARRL